MAKAPSDSWWRGLSFEEVTSDDFGGSELLVAEARLKLMALQGGDPVSFTRSWGVCEGGITELVSFLDGLGGCCFYSRYRDPLGSESGESRDYDFDSAIWSWKRSVVSLSCNETQGIKITLVTNSNEFREKVEKFIRERMTRVPRNGVVYVVSQGQSGPQIEKLARVDVPLERSNYQPDVVDSFDHVVEDLNTVSPCGRLIVLTGIPGTGKSYFIRGIMSNVPEATFLMVPSHMVGDLASPSMMSMLLNSRKKDRSKGPIVLLIEDADQSLLPRMNDNMGDISTLLNLSDGILGAALDIRVVASSNSTKVEMDKALLRPGRVCRLIEFGKLSANRSGEVYKSLTGEDWDTKQPCVLTDIYQKARLAGWKPPEIEKSAASPISFNEFLVQDYYD